MKLPSVARRGQGFTLMEVLVVLVITSFVATVLLQALAQSHDLQRRFGVQLLRSEVGAMQQDWFRQIVQGLQPNLSDGQGRMRGSSRSFSALAIDPFSPPHGAAHQVEMALHSESRTGVTRLSLQAAGRELTLSSWPGLRDAAFAYIDAQGQSHDQWPPPQGVWPALPNAILLRLSITDRDEQIVAAVPRITAAPEQSGQVFQAFAP